MLWLWLNFTPVLLSNIHSMWEKIPSLSSAPILYAFHHLLLSFRLNWVGVGGGRAGRLYIFAWCIFKLEVNKLRVGRSTMWKKKRSNILISTWISIGGNTLTSHNEGRSWTSAGEERGRLSFLESRQNSGEQGQFTTAPWSGISHSSELCISVQRANGKVNTLIFFFLLLLPHLQSDSLL